MIPNDYKERWKMITRMLHHIDEHYEQLNIWEATFIASIANRVSKGQDLTTAQAEKLEQVYDRIQ